METEGQNPFSHLLSEIKIGNDTFQYYNLPSLNDPRYEQLPFSIRVLLESAVRNCDNFQVKEKDIHNILAWEENQKDAGGIEVPFKPSRVILQDFTGVPAVVDFAAMRDAVKDLGGDPDHINPVCPADLVIDHSVQVEFSRTRVAGGGGGGGGGSGGGGGACSRCVNQGHPMCMASWPARQTASSLSRPTSPALRSGPVSPLIRSRPSSPVVYPSTQPIYYIPPPWSYQSSIPSPATPLATFQPLAMGEAAGYQILQGYQVPVYSSQPGPQYGAVYQPPQPPMQYNQVVKPQHPSSYYLGSAYTHHGSIPSSRPTTPENIHTQPTHAHTHSIDVEDLGLRLRRPQQNPSHTRTQPQPTLTHGHTQPQSTHMHTQPQSTHTQPQPTHTQPQPTHTHTQPTDAHTHSVDVEDTTKPPKPPHPTSAKTPSIVEDLGKKLPKPPPQSPRPGKGRSDSGVRKSVSVRSDVTVGNIESGKTGSSINSEGRGGSIESGGGEGDTDQERSTSGVKESVSVPSDITVGNTQSKETESNIQSKGTESSIQSKGTGRNVESKGTDFRDNKSAQNSIGSDVSSESDVMRIGSDVTRIKSDVTSTRCNTTSTCSDVTSFQTNVPTTGVQAGNTSLPSDTARTSSVVTSVESGLTRLQSNEPRRIVPSRSLNTHTTSIRGSAPMRSSRSNVTGFQSAVTSLFSDITRTGSDVTIQSDLTSARSEVTPSLKLPVSSLPSPLDVPGIPIQDEVCPFHEERSEWSDALQKNQDLEFERNYERFVFLKWGAQALKNMLIVPPGSGIVHQVNLEYLARVVFNENGLLFPDSLVGTDSHTTMINGLGVLGWGVGGIEAEAVMLGQAVSMVLPKVVGYRITGTLSPLATSTDVVLTITKHLRQVGVVGKFVEFYGPGVHQLSLADRATISNMCPEYGATVGFFPVDNVTINYLRQSNRDEGKIKEIEEYLKAVRMFRNFMDTSQDPVFSETVTLDLSDVVPSLSGPKRPHDRVSVATMKQDFLQCLSNQVGFKGFGLPADQLNKTVPFVYEGEEYTLQHGSVVIAAITSCTNTSNPSVMLGAGLLAKKAVESGLRVASYIKTSLSPGSGVVTHYLQHSGVTPYLNTLGFTIVGYGCMTCIGNSGPIPEAIVEAIEKNDLVCCGVLSGNRNFEGRIHPNTRANYLASPLLVIAYAIAGRVDIDFEVEPIGTGNEGKPVYLRDIWPSRGEVQQVEQQHVVPALFSDVYKRITTGNTRWNNLQAPEGTLYPWDHKSTYIKKPPFFDGMTKDLAKPTSITGAYVLLNLGDSVTTDHISPAGSIARNSAAARYLASRGLTPREFNSYGSRRGNDAVMARGTFANIRLRNKFIGKAGPRTIHIPTGEELDVFDAAERYRDEGQPVIILAGKEYGSGSSRDWAAKGPFLLGVRAVIAESYERIHRSNLVGMGIIPLQYLPGQTADTLGLTGREKFTIDLPDTLKTGLTLTVKADDKAFDTIMRFDTDVELTYFRHGGILNYMIRKIVNPASV